MKILYREKIESVERDTMFDSFFTNILKHPDFLDLVKMGDEIIPFIINDIKDNTCTWTHILLLRYINEHKNLDYSTIEPGIFRSSSDFWLNWWQTQQRENKLNRKLKEDN
jgi:hypothetical protein